MSSKQLNDKVEEIYKEMIQYTLKCDNEHTFDSWFQSSSAFEKLKTSKKSCKRKGFRNLQFKYKN